MAAAVNFPIRLEDCIIGWMINTATGECIAKPCGKWACVRCGPRNVRRLAARFRRDAPKYNRFITLTLAGIAAPTRETMRRMSAGWKLLRRKLARDFGLSAFAWVHEQGHSGDRVHKHLLVNSNYIPQATLSRLGEACGLGRICDIRAIKGELGMRSYLTKYLVKHSRVNWPRYTRRVQHNLRPEEKPEPEDVWIFESTRRRWRRRRWPEHESSLPEELILQPEPARMMTLF